MKKKICKVQKLLILKITKKGKPCNFLKEKQNKFYVNKIVIKFSHFPIRMNKYVSEEVLQKHKSRGKLTEAIQTKRIYSLEDIISKVNCSIPP